jgi:hypothetical protein
LGVFGSILIIACGAILLERAGRDAGGTRVGAIVVSDGDEPASCTVLIGTAPWALSAYHSRCVHLFAAG